MCELPRCFVVCLALLLGGCVVTMQSEKLPGLDTGSPLSGVTPRGFVVGSLTDARGEDPYVFAKVSVHQYIGDHPIADILAENLRRELRRNGHRAVGVGVWRPGSADYEISGTVLDYSVANRQGYRTGSMRGQARAWIEVRRAGDARVLLSKEYEGDTAAEYGLISKSRICELMHEAGLQVVREFTTDPDFLALLRAPADAKPAEPKAADAAKPKIGGGIESAGGVKVDAMRDKNNEDVGGAR